MVGLIIPRLSSNPLYSRVTGTVRVLYTVTVTQGTLTQGPLRKKIKNKKMKMKTIKKDMKKRNTGLFFSLDIRSLYFFY